nr:PREDICTED: myocyte-specific enhancer factor 2C-like [Latimeria chalumnae]|eukprot:XP_014345949.1 PREDICTED: myocyte-specific enhancer factor 2C-like [Latimeria chalumnae]
MGRKKIQISRIMDQRNRQVTFTKRKFGLMKKAYELSVLCDCEIALIIFNSTNRLFQYASTDMDKVLLKYTEYSEPHESRTNSDILETLRRKGLGLDNPDLEMDDSVEQFEKYKKLNDGMDLTSGRPRFYASSLSNSEIPHSLSTHCISETGVGSHAGSLVNHSRQPVFKSIVSKHASGRSPGPAHSGCLQLICPSLITGVKVTYWRWKHSVTSSNGVMCISYSVVSHSSLNRPMTTKTPPPLNLGTDNRRSEMHAVLSNTRTNPASARAIYSGMQTGNQIVTIGSSGIPGHGIGGFPFPSAGPPEIFKEWVEMGLKFLNIMSMKFELDQACALQEEHLPPTSKSGTLFYGLNVMHSILVCSCTWVSSFLDKESKSAADVQHCLLNVSKTENITGKFPPTDAPPHPGFALSGSLQQSPMAQWQLHHEMPTSPQSHLGVPNSMVSPHDTAITPPPPSINIKSERVSPTTTCASSTSLHHMTRLSPINNVPRGTFEPSQREDYIKGYHCPLILTRTLTEDRANVPMRRVSVSENWQR